VARVLAVMVAVASVVVANEVVAAVVVMAAAASVVVIAVPAKPNRLLNTLIKWWTSTDAPKLSKVAVVSAFLPW
jgi:hypothetical protein